MTKPSHYSSYLLRIWHSAEGDPHGYRVSLQDLATGERLGFATLESLFAFFEATSAEASTNVDRDERKETTKQADIDTELDQ
jgi:hypothetical protein